MSTTLQGVKRAATLSACGAYRWTLIRAWDGRPMLLVVLFNPSTADDQADDPTVQLLCHIAAHNGYGGVVLVNGIPLRTSKASLAADMVNTWDQRSAWDERDRLQDNLGVIRREVARAGAVLLAWGALADLCPEWFDRVIEEIGEELPAGVPMYCLGITAGGHPKHPMARGRHKVPKDAPLLLWADVVASRRGGVGTGGTGA